MRIDYYNCYDDSKKVNKSPVYVASSTCNIYGTCNMDRPAFIVSEVLGNYVKFDGTYYFIDNKIYSGGKWIIQCTIDDLYTNAAEINNIVATAVRNEYTVNSDIQDNGLQLTVRQKNIIKDFGTGIPYAATGKVFLVGIKGE